MSRISIDVTDEEHKKLKAMAALSGRSIKRYVLERTLGTGDVDAAALQDLERLLDDRIRPAKRGPLSRRTVSEVFGEILRKKAK